MSTFKSEDVSLLYPAVTVYNKLSDLEGLKSLLANIPADSVDALPDDKRRAIEGIEVTSDSISIPGGPVGNLMLRVTRREEPTLIKLEGEGTPVPMSLAIHITPVSDSECRAQVVIDLEIPAMLKPMVSGPINKMTSQFAQMIKVIPFDR